MAQKAKKPTKSGGLNTNRVSSYAKIVAGMSGENILRDVDPDMAKPEGSERNRSRNLFGVVEDGKGGRILTGTESEAEELATFIEGLSKMTTGLVLGREYHKDGRVHYHWMATYKSAPAESFLGTVREQLKRWCKIPKEGRGANWTEFGSSRAVDMIRYSLKAKNVEANKQRPLSIVRGVYSKLNTTTIGAIGREIEEATTVLERRTGSKTMKVEQRDELVLRSLVSEFMVSKGITVETEHRRLRVPPKYMKELNARSIVREGGELDYIGFMRLLVEEKVLFANLTSEVKMVERWLRDPCVFWLPYHTYNERYIAFLDKWWDLDAYEYVEPLEKVTPIFTVGIKAPLLSCLLYTSPSPRD